MERRKFLQMLGLAPLAVVVAKFIPAPKLTRYMGIDWGHGPDTTVMAMHDRSGKVVEWEPNTCYNVGDTIILNGKKRKVRWAGISGSTKTIFISN